MSCWRSLSLAWRPLLILAATLPGCATFRGGAVPGNPVFVPTDNQELVWERSVDVLHHNLFEIERENRLDGLIETKYKTGAGLLELWHPDSVGLHARLEGTMQSIRRKAFITVTPADGGYLVGVEAYKELEDVVGAANSAGAATFLENSARKRDLEAVVGQAAPSGWIPKGRDVELERRLLDDLHRAFSR
jgi:hypothetical protein